MSSASQRPQRQKTERITFGGAAAIFLLVIVLFVQYGLDVDVLNVEEDTTPAATQSATSVATAVPGSTIKPIPGGIDGGWFQLYFTQPINTEDESKFHGSPVEEALVAALNSAKTSIDAAMYEVNSQPVTDALIAAHERKIKVRVVVDGEFGLEKPTTTADQLELAGIPLVSDGTRGAFMHNKFFVIDGLYVWTGSTNITHNGMYNNNNNSILIRSSQLAANYTTEFEELFAGKFGKTSSNVVPNPVVTINGTPIETFFESEGNVQDRLAELFKTAKTVKFMAFSFTDSLVYDEGDETPSIMGLLLNRARSGQLQLQGIVEASQRSFAKSLICGGLEVRQDGNPDILHHKVFIIDDSIVVTGSFNFTKSASENNDENVLIIHNTDIAKAYLDEFARRWAEATAPPKSEIGC